MSLNYYFDPQSHVVYVIGQGEVSIDERIRFFQQMLPDPALPKDASVLVDINKITNTPQNLMSESSQCLWVGS